MDHEIIGLPSRDAGVAYLAGSITDAHLPSSPEFGPFADDDDDDDDSGPGGSDMCCTETDQPGTSGC